MKFSKSEYAVFVAAAVIVITFSLLFYFDFTGRTAVGQEQVVGSISYTKRVAQRKYASQVVWDDIEVREPVYNNDSIRTADRSEAIIRLVDGTELTVNENSMILLSFSTNEIEIDFRGGSISANRSGVEEDRAGTLNIKSGETVVSVESSDVQLSGDKEKDINVTVNRGEAKVASGGKEEKIRENQKVVVSKGSEEIKVIQIPVRPLMPLPDSIVVARGAAENVIFTWEALRPEQSGSIEVSDSPLFARTVRKAQITGTEVTLELAPGSYYWRLVAKNSESGAVDRSDARKISVIPGTPAHLVYPGNGQTFRYTKSRPVINFKWNGSDIAQEYGVVISSDPEMRRAVSSLTTSDTSIAVDTLNAGTYYWQVVTVIRVSDRTYRIPSRVHRVDISVERVIAPPRPRFPPNGGSVSGAVIGEKGIVFSWNKSDDIPETMVSVSKHPDFTTITAGGTSTTNFLNIRGRIDPGTYYWRVTGVLPDGRLTGHSEAFRLLVSAGAEIRLVAPVNGAELVPEGPGGTLRFAWEKSDAYGEYAVQVSRSGSFSEIDREETLSGTRAVIPGLGPGTYYWRVLLRTTDGAVLARSRTNTLVVSDLLGEPSILSPGKGEAIDFDRLSEIVLSWKKPAEANLYRLRFYRVENNRAVFVAERNYKKNLFEINDVNFLGKGRFRWTVQAFETSLDGSKIVRKSRVSQSYFDVIQSEAGRRRAEEKPIEKDRQAEERKLTEAEKESGRIEKSEKDRGRKLLNSIRIEIRDE